MNLLINNVVLFMRKQTALAHKDNSIYLRIKKEPESCVFALRLHWSQFWSGREDWNLRPPAPHADALSQTALRPVKICERRYSSAKFSFVKFLQYTHYNSRFIITKNTFGSKVVLTAKISLISQPSAPHLLSSSST